MTYFLVSLDVEFLSLALWLVLLGHLPHDGWLAGDRNSPHREKEVSITHLV